MYLLIDIGGTKTRLTTSNGEVLDEPLIIPTTQYYKAAILEIKKAVFELTGGKEIEACAIGLPGPMDQEKTKLVNAPNLVDWIDKPIKKDLQEIIKAPLFLINDATMVGLGEAKFGAGRGERIVVYLTLSTGVGGTRIINGQVDENALGFEPGHQIITLEGVELESLMGGKSIEKFHGKKAEEIKDPEVWDKVTKILSIGLNNILVFWSPDVVILGGSVSESLDFEKIRKLTKERVKIFPKIPPIKKASLGDLGGLYGGLAFLRSKAT